MACTLPMLIGTDKQIAVAADIRTAALTDHETRIAGAKAKGADPVKIAAVEATVARMAEITDSRWWIEIGKLPAANRLKLVSWTMRPTRDHGLSWHDEHGVYQSAIPL